ncbi:MAG: hypothetical protein HC857_10300 [Synechococcales cyanobacterium RU_4_20]|nr:hypothetical protein [Synechococcales cyanobacterium RU_4_20]
MAKQRVTQALDSLLRSALRLDRNLSVKDRFWLWRSSLLSRPADASTQAGFILPTVTLLLLMLSLILGVLIFRTSNRTNQVIGARQQRQIYNAATPAIERAKAKLEVLFTEDIQTITSDDNIEAKLKVATDPIKDKYTLGKGETKAESMSTVMVCSMTLHGNSSMTPRASRIVMSMMSPWSIRS